MAPTLSLLYLLSPVFLRPKSCIFKEQSMSTPGTERALRGKRGACQRWHEAPTALGGCLQKGAQILAGGFSI